ncbi:MAG: SpoIIE family protein phosphatase [Calditrichaeota bacterium]|nr:SpoIIE family protein phosphatase [Calditrichota bacterium]
MKRIQVTRHILLGLIVSINLITFFSDLLNLKTLGFFNSLEYLHEGLCSFSVWLVYLYLSRFKIFNETDVKKNLKYIILNLVSVYALVFILKLIFNPTFIVMDFPPQSDNLKSIIFANIVSFIGTFSMIGFILSLRNLILYKYKKRTKLYFYITLVLVAVTALLTVMLKAPLDLTFKGSGIYNNTVFSVVLSFLIMLGIRNSWITYLTRKEKYYYLFVSFLFLWAISYLFDYAYELPIPYHSLALGVFINTTWFFLLFYSFFAALYLLLQLPTARVFERKMREVASLQNLSRAISVELDRNKLSALITNLIIEVTGSHYTWIELVDPDDHQLKVAATKNLSFTETSKLERGNIRQLSAQIMEEKKPYVFNDLEKESKQNYFSGLKTSVASLVGVPIIGANEQFFGILYAAKSNTFGFDPDDVNLLEAFANQVAIALENADLMKKSLERERLERELQIAREVQLRLLPQTKPKLRHYTLETLTITAYEVGGDYYDFFYEEDHNLGIVIGDVSGKGTSAAFYMAEAKGIIQSIAKQVHSPREILCHANNVLSESLEKKSFITLLIANIDSKNNQMRFARAGHCPVIHFKEDEKKVEMYQPSGIAVGLDQGPIFEKMLEEQTLSINQGDVLLFYTDGLSEAMNKNNEEYGEERLAQILMKNGQQSVETLTKILIDDIFKFVENQSLHDDLTLILLKRTE